MTVSFHPLVRQWFSDKFGRPTPAQEAGWPPIAGGKSTLIAAPTGSGKTLAAFLWSIDRLIQRAAAGALEDKISVVYVSPLKALGNDIEKNLREPLSGILKAAWDQGVMLPEIRAAVRSGDTPARERQLMLRRPPHILITTPESLYILLTAEKSRRMLWEAETVIIDEIHALAGDKRGSHLSLSLERLDDLAGRPLQRIGLSATQRPIEEIARWLVGTEAILDGGMPRCAIVDLGHRRPLSLAIEVPGRDLGPITTHEIWDEIYGRVTTQIQAHRTTLVFVNTRRLVERVAHRLSELLGEGKVGAHHGSLSRKSRLEVEQGLKSGALRVVVATASMELGIDIGEVDLVCNIGSPRRLATLLQRVGRSGHGLDALPKGILYPLTRDELIECAAAIRALRAGELDRVIIPEKPLDVLAQQIVATVASSGGGRPQDKKDSAQAGIETGIAEGDLRRLIARAYPYRRLTEREFEQVVEILSEGIAARTGRRGAYLHRDQVHGRLRPRRGARLAAITNGGAIPDAADYDVLAMPDETFVGKVNEDFAIETLAGDIFLLGNRSWRIRRVSSGKVWVEDAQGLPPTIPFWLGEAPGRTPEFSRAVSDLRREAVDGLADGDAPLQLAEESGSPLAAAEQMIAYVRETVGLLGCVPTTECVIAERFFDEAGGMQLVLHAPFGARINRAWGMALRKRFCVGFDREIQAAATDDGIVLSLGEQHSFPLADFFSWLRSSGVEKELVQAVLASPMFTNRWRWSANRALAVLRFSGGKKVPMFIQRIRAEELLGQVFPAQLMCRDNRTGPVELPDHPLVAEVIRDCLHEAMDIDGLKEILLKIERGELRTVQVDTPAPSPMAHEILNANPYAFLDDAPLEERRARAVSLRRLDPELARGIGALDPEAVRQVCEEARPRVRDADELHDFLLDVGLLPLPEAGEWTSFAEDLLRGRRAATVSWPYAGEAGGRSAYVAAERWHWLRAIFPESLPPDLFFPAISGEAPAISKEEAIRRIVLGWIHVTGPTTAAELARKIGLSEGETARALLGLEAEGLLLRGEFRSGRGAGAAVEWCERGLLARIHRLTIGQLRREIEPVTAAEFMRFLLRWQHVEPGARLRGREGVAEIVGQLQGLELPAPAWERHVLPSRIDAYDPKDLEDLCLGGVVAWGRLKTGAGLQPEEGSALPAARKKIRRRLAPTRVAPMGMVLREDLPCFIEPLALSWREMRTLSYPARAAADYLERAGASFLAEIAQATGLLKGQTEEALWELVAHGLVTGDGIAGLRVLLTPEVKRRRRRRFRVISGGRAAGRLMPVGRWSLWRSRGLAAGGSSREDAGEFLARQLLRRYGVIFPELLARETGLPPWRTLAQIYRRLENRGEIRGGRFVGGFIGEQFALPEAVDLLRASRRAPAESEAVVVAASDPLNLMGIILPGQRVSPYSNQAIAYLNGAPVESGPLGAVLSRLQRASS